MHIENNLPATHQAVTNIAVNQIYRIVDCIAFKHFVFHEQSQFVHYSNY